MKPIAPAICSLVFCAAAVGAQTQTESKETKSKIAVKGGKDVQVTGCVEPTSNGYMLTRAADKAGDKSIGGMIEGFKTMSAAAEMLTADLRAAKDLHYNTAEYQWVKGQILAASTTAYAEKMGQVLNASMDSSYQQMKKQYDEAKDAQTKQALKPMLDSLEQQRTEQAKQQQQIDPALTYNRQLLSKYENALNAFAQELSKYEDKPGEAKKSVDEFQKNVDKAVQDAKKP